jgi:arabinogalactan endo-1,4-beta-galactosidase
MGADLSYVNQIEDNGGVYRDSNKVKDPFLLFRQRGANTVRVRLWHNPTWYAPLTKNRQLYSDLKDVEKTIQRAKNAGMAVNLDLHYSDDWADPQKQLTPAAWTNLPLSILKDSVYRYTMDVLTHLKNKNLTPEMIQIGNEANAGILHPVGKIVNNDFRNFGELLNSGIKAVRDFSTNSSLKPQIILHCAQLQHAEWWTNGITTGGGVSDFDIIGLSHYAKWSTVGTMAEIGTIVKNLKNKYGKKVMIVETATPWTNQNADNYTNIIAEAAPNYSLSKEEQLRYLKDLTQTVMTAGGNGIHYWEPAWISSPMRDRWGTGSSWDNCALFDFSGNALVGLDFMTFAYKF